jgi:hypothetical protein
MRKSLTDCGSVQELQVTVYGCEQEMNSSLDDLKAAMRSDNIGTAISFVKELVDVKSPLLASLFAVMATTSTTAAMTARNLQDAPLGAIIGGIAVTAAILLTSASVSLSRSRQKALTENPYAYLFLAQKKGVLG